MDKKKYKKFLMKAAVLGAVGVGLVQLYERVVKKLTDIDITIDDE